MKQTLIIACCMLVLLFSCAHPRKAEYEAVTHQSQQYYDTGEYKKALDSYHALHVRFPEDTHVTGSYYSMVEKIKKQSDTAYAKGDYAAAYKNYRLLTDYHDDFSNYQKMLSFSKSFLTERIKSAHIKLAENTSQQAISSGHFQKAITACRELITEYRKDKQSQKCLMTAASELYEMADSADKKGEYEEAGKIYAVLRKNVRTFKTAGIPLETLDKDLENCSRNLNIKALALYRKGDLRQALSVWKNILEFDPANAEARKSIATTTDQLKNMQ